LSQPGWRPETTFQLKGWASAWDSRRLSAAAAALAFAAGIGWSHTPYGWLLASVILLETAGMTLPWRVPRLMRGAVSFWAETLVGLIAPLGTTVLVLMQRPTWLTTGSAWWWYVVAVALTIALFALSDLNLRGLFSGELSFVFGPTPRSHGSARAFASACGAIGEEFLYRAPVILGLYSFPLALLGGAGFVARHHLQPGTNRRGTARSTATEISAAGGLLALTMLSHSIYPALLAHLFNNVPNIVLELQREHDPRTGDLWPT